MTGLKNYVPACLHSSDEHILKYKNNPGKYRNIKAVNFIYTQLSTGTAVELAQKTGTAISNIGKTEITLVGAWSANDVAYNGGTAIATAKYKDNAGLEWLATCTAAADSTTEVAFLKIVDGVQTATAVTDFYCFLDNDEEALTTNIELQAGEDFQALENGALTYGTIQATAQEAVDDDLLGIGTVYGRYHTNHDNYDGAVQYMEYQTPWGERKWAKCTTNTTDSTTETLYYLGSAVSRTGVVTATTATVKDFYRLRTLYTSVTPNATHTYLLTDAACANVDGSGNDVWAMVEEAYYYSITSAYWCSPNHEAVLHRGVVDSPADATNYVNLVISFKAFGHLQSTTSTVTIAYTEIESEVMEMEMEPDTSMTMTIVDAANAITGNYRYQILEAELERSLRSYDSNYVCTGGTQG